MNNSVIILIAVVAFCAAVFIAWYLMKNLRFTKGNYGKQTVKSILKRFAFPRKYKVLENVSMELDGKTQTIDFVMVGEFGLLFVSALQGKGDFYGDFTEEYWSFVDNEKKVRFLNPVKEMDKKLDMFRRLMAKKKVYNLKIESAVVIVGSKADAPMYLSHVGKENIVMTVNQFKKLLEKEKFESSIYIMVDTLEYLKKGGRITPAAAALGTLLKLKPVLQIQGEKLDAFAKARTVKQAKTIMTEAMKNDFEKRFHSPDGEKMNLELAYTFDTAAAEAFKEEVQAVFPDNEIVMQPLSLSIACHIGPGALAVALSNVPKELCE